MVDARVGTLARRRILVALSTVVIAILSVRSVEAHVSVVPSSAAPGEEVAITIRVPVERAVATTGFEVQFPPEITVLLVKSTPGWSYEVLRDSQGRITGVRWSEGQIRPGEFDDFTVLARMPAHAGSLTFVARQTSADGDVQTWDGEEAPTLTLAPGAAGSTPSASTPATWLPTVVAWLAVATLVTWEMLGRRRR